MKHFFKLILLFITTFNCAQKPTIEVAKNNQPLISYVNPFIGTGGHGHTYPGATMPFGMMQLSPDTRLDGWDGCSGYHYSDDYIYGFSHTHLSGTGVSDYGDILLMPTNKVDFNNGADGKKGYKAHFSHDNEMAEPGYYKVHLDATNIDVELTVSKRSGVQKYQFSNSKPQIVILDLEHRDEVLGSKIHVISNSEVSGYRHSKAWATNQMLFYNIQFSRPFKKITLLDDATKNKKVKAAFEFDASESDKLQIKI
ncbi:MAG: glycoside hydrolase family 92 protein, partial [Gelidibacter sp.]|nr:glycoside hydrolase family 92 protein [Gelidibacter sp.]